MTSQKLTILAVDEDPDVLRRIVALVGDDGPFTVFTAANGEAAVALAGRLPSIDLLIADLYLSDINGLTLRNTLRAHLPNLRSFFTTSYDVAGLAEHLEGEPVFGKPIDFEQLALRLSELLDNGVTLEVEPAPEDSVAVAVAVPKSSAVARADVDREAVVVARPVAAEVKTDGADAVSAAGAEDQESERSKSQRLRNLVERPGFTGKLDQFQLVDIIQMCCISRRTGRLRISRGVANGVLYLRGGNFIHALAGQYSGVEAVNEIVSWHSGQFQFEDSVSPDEETISGGWEHVLMEALRLRDERNEAAGVVPAEAEDLSGRTLGDYQVIRKLGSGVLGDLYLAKQLSMDRLVTLKVLWSAAALDAEAVSSFIADASAKAQVQHRAILSVFEAGEAEGHYFYAREYVDGSSLEDIIASGGVIDDVTALAVLRVASEALSYLNHFKIPHDPLDASRIFLQRDGAIRIANVATVGGEQTQPVQQEMSRLANAVMAATQAGASASPAVLALLARM
ncbi:MAG: DUF4388 domain-containing protein, partial [Verrucomicrobiia bacterium]